MIPLVALCVDEVSMAHPELIGLDGERLGSQSWLRLFSDGEQMRAFLRNDRSVDEAWVVSCSDVEPINLAATLKADRGDVRVCLITFQGTGSLRSRASAAAVDVMLTRQALATRYAAFKRIRSAPFPANAGAGKAAGAPQAVQVPEPGMADGTGGQCVDAQPSSRGAQAAPATSKQDSSELFQPEEPRLAALDEAGGAAERGEGGTGARVAQAAPEEASFPQSITVTMEPGARREAVLLPVVSGSGGAGKSTVAALTSLIAQQRGLKTLLLDFDLQFGDMREIMGQPEALGIDEALEDPTLLAKLEPALGMPALLGAPRHLEEAEAIARRAPVLLDALRGMFDVIVANTGAAWAEQHAVLLERCSKALFLIDQRASSLRACRHALDLCARCGIAVNPFLFGVNFCTKNAPLTSIDVACALRGAETFELADGGAEVEEILSEGHPGELLETSNPLIQSICRLLPTMIPALGEAEEQQDMPSGGIGTLFRRRRKRRRGVA